LSEGNSGIALLHPFIFFNPSRKDKIKLKSSVVAVLRECIGTLLNFGFGANLNLTVGFYFFKSQDKETCGLGRRLSMTVIASARRSGGNTSSPLPIRPPQNEMGSNRMNE
jgi:hypothetical protein